MSCQNSVKHRTIHQNILKFPCPSPPSNPSFPWHISPSSYHLLCFYFISLPSLPELTSISTPLKGDVNILGPMTSLKTQSSVGVCEKLAWFLKWNTLITAQHIWYVFSFFSLLLFQFWVFENQTWNRKKTRTKKIKLISCSQTRHWFLFISLNLKQYWTILPSFSQTSFPLPTALHPIISSQTSCP